ncbi:MobF family relaxase [Ferrimicrobium acidiphilum]|uniref:Multifunctional conjugation protein TraI n=1 Tax=Ferrimicrobium acidiphilum DSM 19497 TaxID=1121877 RepID=A0A0D8FY93_9ACTN|nr:MobF family relaxase [Ferrimicrobium acidiphilum]KJE78195.1 multifunctional conjugation protein TraI [Ferrimicrobium acidiphilum DSM 19497]
MRLFKIRGSLGYYAQQELSDEIGIMRRLDFSGSEDRDRTEVVGLGDAIDAAEGVRNPIKALDFTIAAPKAVSVLWALASDAERDQIEGVHHVAVARTFRLMVELDSAKCSRGVLAPIENLAAFDIGHRLSRAGDPHLHSHLVVINSAMAGDRTVALDHERWARGLPVYELCYRSELAHLLHSLGVELTGIGLESWQIKGQPESLLTVFSKRRHDVVATVEGSRSSRSRQLAVLATRQPKVLYSQAELRARWESEARLGADRAPLAVPARGGSRAVAKVRVNDPLLNEFARAIEQGASGIQAVTEVALVRAFGEEHAFRLLSHGKTGFAGKHIGLDGTLCQSYRSLSVSERLLLMETPMSNLKVVHTSRELVSMVQAFEQAGVHAGDRVAVATRTPQEAALIVGFGNYRPSSMGPTLIVDANAMSASELHELVRRGPTLVRSPGEPVTSTTSTTVLGLEGAASEALVVAESAGVLWNLFVADCTRWVESECEERVFFSTPSAGLTAKLRREVAIRSPDSVVGHLGSKPLFRGERVVLADGSDGRIIKLDGDCAEIRVGESTEICRTGEIRFMGFGMHAPGCKAVTYGASAPEDGLVERAYLCQPELSDLTQSLELIKDQNGVSWIQDTAVASISQARLRELVRTNGRFIGEELYRLRSVTNTLSGVYDRAEEFGFDSRRGRDRIMDERLAMQQGRSVRGRGNAYSNLGHLSWEQRPSSESELTLER